MDEYPTAEQLQTLRERGWQIITTLNGLKAHRDGRTIGWREALGQTEQEETENA